jgi:hypothetical protein
MSKNYTKPNVEGYVDTVSDYLNIINYLNKGFLFLVEESFITQVTLNENIKSPFNDDNSVFLLRYNNEISLTNGNETYGVLSSSKERLLSTVQILSRGIGTLIPENYGLPISISDNNRLIIVNNNNKQISFYEFDNDLVNDGQLILTV